MNEKIFFELKLKVEQLNRLLEVTRVMRNFSPQASILPVKYNISYDEFKTNYLFKNEPVLIKGLIDNWGALKRWSLDYFANEFGDSVVEIITDRNSNSNYEIERDKLRKKLAFFDFIEKIKNSPSSNNFYLTANNDFFTNTNFSSMLQDLLPVKGFIDSIKGPDFKFWLGPATTVTPLHFDNTNLILIQVFGRKRIKLIPAQETHLVYTKNNNYSSVDLSRLDFDKFPLMRRATIMEVILNPGDILFIPVFWWHYVEALEISASLSYINLKPNIIVKKNKYTVFPED